MQTLPPIYLLTAVAISYLCGSIPSSIWWGRAWYGVDVRRHGSGNAGATNTFRVLGAGAGIPVLLLDVAKGFLPARLLPLWWGGNPFSDAWNILTISCMAAAIIGHLYPVFAGFKGGKGVATSLGGILALHPGVAVVCMAIFLLLMLTTRIVSLASLCAALAFPVAVLFIFKLPGTALHLFSIGLSAVVFYTHRQNIARLWAGTESRLRIGNHPTPRSK